MSFEERYTRSFTVEADSEEEAIELASNEDPDDGLFEFVENSGVEVKEA